MIDEYVRIQFIYLINKIYIRYAYLYKIKKCLPSNSKSTQFLKHQELKSSS